MSKDAKKDADNTRTGFKLFPREWEGLSDAFPEAPLRFNLSNPLLPSLGNLVYGGIAGVLYNSIRALRKKPLQHAVLNGIGLVTIPITLLNAAASELGRRKATPDVKAILQADGIAMPQRKFIKRVKGDTVDESALFWGLAAMAGLQIYRRAPNIPKVNIFTWIGSFTVGQFAGIQIYGMEKDPLEGATALAEYKLRLEKAKQIYTTRTLKPPDPFLYPDLKEDSHKIGLKVDLKSVTTSSGDAPAAVEGMDQSMEWLISQEEPSGAAPHMLLVKEDGTKAIIAQRDYAWNPATKTQALESLQDHLEDIQNARTRAVQSAQYVWDVLCKREAAKFQPFGRDDDDEAVVLEKKALELLASIHKGHYSMIADLDWCIANTQKLMLQVQSDGKWVPQQSDLTGAAEAREKLLENVRTHKKNLEVQNSTIDETMKLMPIDDEEKKQIVQAVGENLTATAKLLDDLESERS